jgi:hypothetical protein
MLNESMFSIRIRAIKAKDNDNYAIMMGFARTDKDGRPIRPDRKLVKTVDDIETVTKSIIVELTSQLKGKL